MGNRQHNQIQELEFYTKIEDATLGECAIYTSNKFSHCFVIKIIRPLSQLSQFELFSQIQNQQNVYLIGLYGYRVGKNCKCEYQGMVEESVTSFWEYLSFSVKDIINQKRSSNAFFEEGEIWHIIRACASGYEAFRTLCISFSFAPSRIKINQDGRVRLDWMQVQPKNTHTHLYRKINCDWVPLNEEQLLAPEELYLLYLKQFTHKINLEKTDVFSLGMTLLHCVTLLEPTNHFYFQYSLNYNRINEAMNSERCQRYSSDLLYLIGAMLTENYQQRPDFGYIRKRYQSLMRPEYHIRTTKALSIDQNVIGKEYQKISISKQRRQFGMGASFTSPTLENKTNQ